MLLKRNKYYKHAITKNIMISQKEKRALAKLFVHTTTSIDNQIHVTRANISTRVVVTVSSLTHFW